MRERTRNDIVLIQDIRSVPEVGVIRSPRHDVDDIGKIVGKADERTVLRGKCHEVGDILALQVGQRARRQLGRGIVAVGEGLRLQEEIIGNARAVAVHDLRIPRGVHILQICDVLIGEVVGRRHAVGKTGEEGIDIDLIVQLRHIGHILRRGKGGHHRGKIERALRNRNRVIGKHILFRLTDKVVEPVGERQHEANADNADTARNRRQNRAPFFGEQISCAESKRCEKAHAGTQLLLLFAL